LLAPAGTPANIVRKLNADTTSALSSADLGAALAQQGAQPGGGTPEEFRRFMHAEIGKWRQAIVRAKIPLAN
jgi:tripartite-type tricarboxylate transporter receptor subunit TctC